jgi:PAS domain S-box-containing protein
MNERPPTILLINCDSQDRERYRHYLLQNNDDRYAVLEADSGATGLALWQTYRPDCVLLDEQLPDLDGLAVLTEIRQRLGQSLFLPVIVLTNQPHGAIANQTGAEIQDYLVKEHCNAETLRIAVNAAMRTLQLHQQLGQCVDQQAELYRQMRTDWESMTDAYVSLDREWRITYVNQATARLNNLAPEDMIGRTHWDVWPWSVGTIVEQNYRQAMAEQVPVHFEVLYEPLTLWLEIHAYPSLQGLNLYFRDVSHYKQAEAALQQTNQALQQQAHQLVQANESLQTASEELHVTEEELRQQNEELIVAHEQIELEAYRYQELFNFAPDGYVVTNANGMIQEANQAIAALVAIEQNYLVNTPLVAYITDSDRHAFRNLLYGLRQQPQSQKLQTDALSLKSSPGFLVPVAIAGTAIRDAQQCLLGVRWLIKDISHRKQAEMALRASELRYRTLFEAIDEGFCVCEMLFDQNNTPIDYRFLEMNPAFERLTGLSQAIGKTARELVPDLEAFWFETYGKVAQTGEAIRFENQSIAMSRWFDVYAFRIDEPRHHRFAVLFTNITERKQAEAELEQRLHDEQALRSLAEVAELKLQQLLASIREDFVLLDHQWHIMYLNASAAATMRKPSAEIINQCFWDLFPELVGTEFYDRLHQAMRDQTSTQFQYHYSSWNRWFENRVYPTPDGIVILCTDITDRKVSEAELRQKNAILNALNEAAPTPIFVKDRQGYIIYANPATLEVLGKSAAEVIGYRDCDLYPHPEDAARVMENDQRVMASGQTEVVEETPDGVRTFLGMKSPYFNEAGEVIGLIGIANDISDRVQFERDRERILQQEQAARAAAERANRIKDEFLTVLSHELRSPLNPILSWASLLQRRKFDETRTAQALATIERNAKLQCQLIDDLLDVAKILRGKLTLNTAPIQLAPVITAALETVQTAAVAKSIQIQTELPSIIQVSGDPARLQQIVWNLLTNAIKFTPTGGQVIVQLQQVGHQAQITVSDTGKGISPEFLPHIFEHFRQEDASITRKYGGLGLGLAIVRHLVEAHGGTITANSLGEGQGATFTVYLPLVSNQPELSVASELPKSELNLAGIRVLVVDDEPDTREVLAVILESYGAEVATVASATEVLTQLDQFQPHVLVSDIGMPNVDGYRLLQQVRTRSLDQGGQIPAIALTAYAREEDRQQALAAGFQEHIAKPIEPDALVKAIATLLRSN